MSEEKPQNNPNQLEIEKKWQSHWQENNVFQPEVDPSKEKFFATVPYPYANSALHIGHGRSNTAADIFARFQRLKNKNVLFPMGFHISGTPVLAVADGIKRGDEKQIKLTSAAIAEYVSDEAEQKRLLESFVDPIKIADFFSSKIEETFGTIGLSLDWSRQFTTGDEGYKKFVQWQFNKLKQVGILLQGKYPILYCAADENAVGEDDIKDGDTDKVTVQEMTYLLFKDKTEDLYFAVATLRPDALFGTTNMWISETKTVCKVNVDGKVWVVSKEAVEKLENQFDDVTVISEHKGSEFVGRTVITPLINREVLLAKADFLDPKHGTGLAYSSPAGSPHDFMGLTQAKKDGRIPESVEVINTVETVDKKKNIIAYPDASCPAEFYIKKYNITTLTDAKLEDAKQELYKEEHYGGKLNELCGEFAGIYIKQAKDKVHQALVDAGLGGTLYETSRRAKTRAGDDVIVANLHGQWFLDYSDEEVKQKAYDLFDSMEFLPSNLRATQRGYLSWVQKRPCARKRGIGTPLPDDEQWIIEPLSDSTIYQMYYLIANYIAGDKLSPSDLTEDFLDFVLLGKGTAPSDVATQIRTDVEYWKAFDFRYTAPPHMSNHLSFLIYHYALIFEKEYQPKNITVGGLLIKDGQKISKSKGNGIPLIQIREMYGADLYRLYVAVAASFDAEMDFRDEEITQLNKRFNKWKEYMFAAKTVEPIDAANADDIDTWLISQFYTRAKVYLSAMDEFKFRDAYVSILYEFLNDISYHERRSSKEKTVAVLRFVFKDYVKLMTPVTPHVCEELFAGEGDELVSLSAFDTDCDSFIKSDISDIESMTQEVLRSVPNLLTRREMTKANKITLVQASDERFALFDKIKSLLAETRDFKKIMTTLNSEFSSEGAFIKRFVPKTLGEGLSAYLAKEEELVYLNSVSDFLKNEFDCEIEIKALEDMGEVKVNALPGKPAVIVE